MTTHLSFSTLRAANVKRLPLFKNSRGEPTHSKPDGSDWSLGEWMNAVLGELGETANLVKKVKRGDLTLDAAREELGREFADIITYADITAMRMEIIFGNPGWTFEDMARYVDIRKHLWTSLSLGELMNRSFAFFGRAADYIDARGMRPESLTRNPFVSDALFEGVAVIGCAANSIGVDLAQEVTNKFNLVSRRVGANVYIIDNTVNDGGGPL